jgi:hypothetical protein
MSASSQSSVQIKLRYVVTYILFAILALAGLFVFVRLRANLLDILAFFGISVYSMRALNTWGTFLLFIPYLGYLAWLEAFMHKGAQINRVWQRAGIVLACVAGVALLSALITFLSITVPSPYH